MKTFTGDFNKFLNKLKNKENFAISRFGDGELMIIEGIGLDLLSKGAGEFAYDQNNTIYNKSRHLLSKSFTHKSDDYYVGIACKCCVGDEKYNYMKALSEQNEEHLTWANIFVNSNFNRCISEMLPELNNRKVGLICHEASNTDNLPFNIYDNLIFKVKPNAWVENLYLIDEIKELIKNNNYNDVVFLISAGPFANILAYELNNYNNNNTYIDIGSVLDKHLKLPLTRGYQRGADTLNKVCVW